MITCPIFLGFGITRMLTGVDLIGFGKTVFLHLQHSRSKIMKTYVKPQVTAHGSVEALTQASTSGSFLDAHFKAGTPIVDVTLS